jgi:hypothetical protein
MKKKMGMQIRPLPLVMYKTCFRVHALKGLSTQPIQISYLRQRKEQDAELDYDFATDSNGAIDRVFLLQTLRQIQDLEKDKKRTIPHQIPL